MAVEYQAGQFFFLPNTKPVPRKWFAVNFLHDLESVLWMFTWFMFNHIPARTILSADDLSSGLRQLAKEEERLFHSKTKPSLERYMFITCGGSSTLYQGLKLWSALYFMTNGLNIVTDLHHAYKDLEKADVMFDEVSGTPRWDYCQFSEGIYTKFCLVFSKLVTIMQNDPQLDTTVKSRQEFIFA